ncbi:hypothetical protein DIPPA_03545 [Diplonema papillatum]|nr:hypothetical protein DIPPA_03545 [Diplonema papillatum]
MACSEAIGRTAQITWEATKGSPSPAVPWRHVESTPRCGPPPGLQPDGGDAACSLSMPPSAEAR